MSNIQQLVQKQREYFNSYATRSVSYRREQLLKIKKLIRDYEGEINSALYEDLNKSEFESYATEIGMVKAELDYLLKNLNKLAKPQKVGTPLMHFPAKSTIYHDPYGVVLIMSPWNYPIYLTLAPLLGAISAGNCVIIKPSNYSRATSELLARMLSCFDERYISVVLGGRDTNTELLDQTYDYIFFTGSPAVGKIVMQKAAEHLTPITLELGGKSPCIVDKSSNLELAGKRIAWGKMLNSSQTCVAPDYILVHEEVKNELILMIEKYIKRFYGTRPQDNDEYPKIINEQHFNRLKKLLANAGENVSELCNDDTRKIALTLIANADWDSEVMQEELFGPILPIITFSDINSAIADINTRPHPLALYLFTNNKAVEKLVMQNAIFGGGCINDTIIHLANSNLPFGGVGASGMGGYHGKNSFYTFSHAKSVTKKSNKLDINIRYAPYGKKIGLLKKFL